MANVKPAISFFERSVEDVTETVKKAAARGSKCTMLIGAGCSKSAGIPLTSEFVEIIKREYPRAYRYAAPATYASCMDQLSHSERKSLISKYIDAAKINWGHIALAQLVQDGVVDRVLTTNFDPLVVRACALIGEYPAIYDAASSQISNTADIHDRSIFYLHGQRTGFKILNTQEEVGLQFENLRPVFDEAGVDRIWIVVGYSGENDPVFEHLVRLGNFKNNLYWICHKDSLPPSHVTDRLLCKGLGTFFVRGHDADSFLIRIAQECATFPPLLFGMPEKYLIRIKETTMPFPLGGDIDTAVSVTEPIDRLVQVAQQRAKRHAKKSEKVAQAAIQAYAAGDYSSVVNLWNRNPKLRNKDWQATAAAALYAQIDAKKKSMESEKKSAAEFYDFFYAWYREAMALFPRSIALINGFAVLLLQKSGVVEFKADERLAFLDEAEMLLNKAIKIQCNSPALLANLGRVFHQKGIITKDPAYYRHGLVHYRRSLDLDPKFKFANSALGNCALHMSYLVNGTERDQLLAEAEALLCSNSEALNENAYNLACICNLRGNSEAARTWLKRSIDSGKAPLVDHMKKDSDFEKVREDAWFLELIKLAELRASSNLKSSKPAAKPAGVA